MHAQEKNRAFDKAERAATPALCRLAQRDLERIARTEFAFHKIADHRQTRAKPGFAVLTFGVMTAGTEHFRRIGGFDSHPI